MSKNLVSPLFQKLVFKKNLYLTPLKNIQTLWYPVNTIAVPHLLFLPSNRNLQYIIIIRVCFSWKFCKCTSQAKYLFLFNNMKHLKVNIIIHRLHDWRVYRLNDKHITKSATLSFSNIVMGWLVRWMSGLDNLAGCGKGTHEFSTHSSQIITP